jgi:hypothetical protein
MDGLLNKLNYKGYKRIALLNADDKFRESFSVILPDVKIDTEIDPRYPYEFILLFVHSVTEVENFAPRALHNLVSDGILWFAYPRKTSKRQVVKIDRDHGWNALVDRGLNRVRQVAIDDDWSAVRFRNIRFIKSSRGRFTH